MYNEAESDFLFGSNRLSLNFTSPVCHFVYFDSL